MQNQQTDSGMNKRCEAIYHMAFPNMFSDYALITFEELIFQREDRSGHEVWPASKVHIVTNSQSSTKSCKGDLELWKL